MEGITDTLKQEFRESGNLSEGKMTKSNFTKEMLK